MTEQHQTCEIIGWTIEPTRRWFAKCDTRDHKGRRRQIAADYFEGYLDHDGPFLSHGWMWVCSGCLMEDISDRLETAEGERG